MTAPYPKTSGQGLQEANMLGFLAAQQQPGMGPAEDRKHQNLALGSQRAVSRNVLGLRQNLVGTGAKSLGHEAVGAAHRFSLLTGRGNPSNSARSAQHAPTNRAAQPGIQPARADTTGILPARATAVASRFEAPDNWQKRAVEDTWGSFESADEQLSVQ
jgi:hypothetical protein